MDRETFDCIREPIESVVARKKGNRDKTKDSAGISIGERVEAAEGSAEGMGGGKVQNQSWLVEKRP